MCNLLDRSVFLGMSGGVDSSVSAILLQEQGYKVTGVYMKNWSKDLPGMKCPWAEDLADAKRVAVQLGIDFEVWDFEQEYHDQVVRYMLSEFEKGRTPNPDVICNELIKFKLFYERALARGADFIATGHYAKTGLDSAAMSRPAKTGSNPSTSHSAKTSSDFSLLRSTDENKDQTYFLYRMSDEATHRTLFPIGHLKKPEVKSIAREHGLDVASKKESMGVCFVGEVGMKDFLKEYLATAPGEIREQETNQILGYHSGAILYTIGQRHGLYLGGGLPYYVVGKNLETNIVYVSRNLNHPSLWADRLKLYDWHLRDGLTLAGLARLSAAPAQSAATAQSTADTKSPASTSESPDASSSALTVRLRHRAPLIPVTIDPASESLIFKQPVKRPAAGQSAVLYLGEACLGGGIIGES